ncbi:ABC transporter permease [Nitriliruptoraceae bacterium ZYF776]|nr:ABC transporter permease [Profundirhabdus halotolerans]
MLRLTFSQLRHSVGRLVSAGLAIAIGTAFVAATLVAGDVLNRTSVQALSAGFGDADLVVAGDELDADSARAVGELSGVAATHAVLSTVVQVEGGGTTTFVSVAPFAPDPDLQGAELVSGGAPAAGEIALGEALAQRLDVRIGDEVPIRRSVWRASDEAEQDGAFEDVVERVRLVGILDDPAAAFSGLGTALGDPDQVRTWATEGDHDGAARYDHLLLRLDDDAASAEVADRVAEVAPGLDVRTREAYAAERAEALTGGGNILSAVGLAFGAVALLVAGLVIANTFSVVVAQRTRTLALLRCVGANRRQLRRSVLMEASMLALAASLVGIVVGLGLAQATLMLFAATSGGGILPSTIDPGPSALLVPLVAGLVVTTVAASFPARAASRVAPLAALRPTGSPDEEARTGRRRRVVAGAMVLAGLAMLAGALSLGSAGHVGLGLLVGVTGGAASFVGVLLTAVSWVPRVIRLAGAGIARRGDVTAALAAANSVRNPRRTAATSSALLIGVTLVAMMSSGASMARASFDQEFDRSFPVDAQVGAPEGANDPATLSTERVAALRALDGVADAAATTALTLQVVGAEDTASLEVTVVDPDEVQPIVRDPAALTDLGDDVLLVPEHLAEGLELGDRTVPVDAQDQALEAGGELRVETRAVSGSEVLMTRATAERLDLDVTTTGVWVRFLDDAEIASVVRSIQDTVADDGVVVRSAAAERGSFDEVVSTLLQVVLGLLGVAVVIALVGVANTLSLSVIERARESATLRAIGLTRRQLRRTLAIEALFIAGAGAVIGTALGTFYGYVGSVTVLGELADGVPLAVPWFQLTALVAVSLFAGVTASVLPGRRAAATSPVAALAGG